MPSVWFSFYSQFYPKFIVRGFFTILHWPACKKPIAVSIQKDLFLLLLQPKNSSIVYDQDTFISDLKHIYINTAQKVALWHLITSINRNFICSFHNPKTFSWFLRVQISVAWFHPRGYPPHLFNVVLVATDDVKGAFDVFSVLKWGHSVTPVPVQIAQKQLGNKLKLQKLSQSIQFK